MAIFKHRSGRRENQAHVGIKKTSHAIAELQQRNARLGKQIGKNEKDLSKLKSRFVSTVSHELRTSLDGILTSAALIDRYNQKGNQEKINQHIQTIKELVQNLAIFLDEFLSLEKLGKGRLEYKATSCEVETFSPELRDEMQTLTKKNETKGLEELNVLSHHNSLIHYKKMSSFFMRAIFPNIFFSWIKEK